MCSSSPQCACGLTCTLGECLQPCTTPGSQGSCSAGYMCTDLGTTPASNACLLVNSVDTSCISTGLCTAGAQCDLLSTSNTDAGPMADDYVCHTTCGAGNTCTGGKSCLPSTIDGYLELQAAADGGVPCNPDGGANSCSTQDGFSCFKLTRGGYCSQLIKACGTAVGLVDERINADGGLLNPVPADKICDYGVSGTVLGFQVTGSRFCDPFSSLANPPYVSCDSTYGPNDPIGSGVCRARCQFPAILGYVQENYDCPASYTCTSGRNSGAGYYSTQPPTACNQASDCAAFASFGGTAECFTLSDGSKTCISWAGVCQPQ